MNYESKNLNYESKNLNYESRKLNYESRKLSYGISIFKEKAISWGRWLDQFFNSKDN
jgi:hypothetical protein